jgi:hypothetical protein
MMNLDELAKRHKGFLYSLRRGKKSYFVIRDKRGKLQKFINLKKLNTTKKELFSKFSYDIKVKYREHGVFNTSTIQIFNRTQKRELSQKFFKKGKVPIIKDKAKVNFFERFTTKKKIKFNVNSP